MIKNKIHLLKLQFDYAKVCYHLSLILTLFCYNWIGCNYLAIELKIDLTMYKGDYKSRYECVKIIGIVSTINQLAFTVRVDTRTLIKT